MNPALRATAWLGALVATLVALLATGDRLAAPPLLDPTAAWSWLQQTDPGTAAFSLVRLATIAVVAYLLLVTIVLVAAQATRIRVLIAASTHLTLPAARRLVRHAVGAGLAVGMAAAAPVVAGAQTPTTTGANGSAVTVTLVAPDPPPVLQHLGDDLVLVHLGAAPDSSPGPTDADEAPATPTDPSDPSSGATDALRPPPAPMTSASPSAPPGVMSTPATPTMPSVPASEPSAPTDPEPRRPAMPATTADRAPDQPDDDRTITTHTIVMGDHLWGVSEQTLTDAWGIVPDPDDVAAYLDRVIDGNRSVLAIPDDPDLVFPGQVFTLPPVPAR